MREPMPQTIHLKDYTPPPFTISTVDLDVDIRDDHATVKAKMAVSRNTASAEKGAPLSLNGDELELVSVAIDGRLLDAAEYTCDAEHLRIHKTAKHFTLETVVRIRPQQNTKLEGLYGTKSGFFTQCEAEGFRRITYFLDRPDVMARYTNTIHAERDQYPVLLSNGNLVASGIEESPSQPSPASAEGDKVRHWAKF